MILSEQRIREAVESSYIRVGPSVTESQFQPASLDVRLGRTLYDANTDSTRESETELTLQPERPYIGHTLDTISLPNDIAAMLTGRSSVGRQGLIIHKTAGWIDPGFSGQLTLEMYNFTSEPISLEVGSRVGQLVFFEVKGETDGYHGQYQYQRGITK